MENRITIEELKERYNVSERTLRTWKDTKGLPLREITPQNKWVYENELKKWETSFIQCEYVERVLEQWDYDLLEKMMKLQYPKTDPK